MARAGNAIIGALKVILSADTAQFETGLKSARNSLNSFSKSITKPLAAVGAALAGALTTVTIGLKLAINSADELSKASQKFGIPIDQLSALKYAADLAGVAFDELGIGVQKLSQSMAKGSKGLQALGISTKDAFGNLRDPMEVLLDVADAFAKAEDGAAKTAIAINIFGKSGAILIPLLNEGAAGIKKMTDEARELGLVITSKTGKAAEQFNDNLDRLQAVFAGVFLQLVERLGPALADATDKLVELAKSGDLVRVALDAVNAIFKFGAGIVIEFNTALEKLNRIATFTAQTFSILMGQDPNRLELIIDAFDRMKQDLLELNTQAREAIDNISLLRKTGGGPDRGEISGLPVVEQAKKKILDASSLETKEAKPDFIEMIPAGYADAVKAGDRYQAQLEKTRAMWDSIGQTIENGALNAIDDLIDGTLTWKSALQNVLNIATQILANIGSNSIANAGGFGAIAGFATGGSFKVGGTGGIDSQLVQFMATPGEMVHVVKGNEESQGGMVFAPVSNITVGAGVSRDEIKLALDARDRAIARSLPQQIKSNRTRARI